MKKTNRTRPLTSQEIAVLMAGSCECGDWSRVRVATDFLPKNIEHTRFSGDITLGVFTKKFTLPGGVTRTAGIRDAALHNCSEGDKRLDFEEVRGAFETNAFVEAVKRHIVDKHALGDELIARMERLG